MTRTSFIILALNVVSIQLVAQNDGHYTIRTGHDVYSQIPHSEIYFYPKFTAGKVIYKNQKEFPALLNYNAIKAEVEFINENGDTAVLTDKKNLRMVAVATDTFLYDGKFLISIGKDLPLKIAVEEKFCLVNRQ